MADLKSDQVELLTKVLGIVSDQKTHLIEELAKRLEQRAADLLSVLGWFQQIEPHLSISSQQVVAWQPRAALLSAQNIVQALSSDMTSRLAAIEVRPVCASTNIMIEQMDMPAVSQFTAAFGDYQFRGVGRQGRPWLSPFAAGLCFTIACALPGTKIINGALSLAIGVAISKTIAPYTRREILIKWPNDLIIGNGKLGGILVNTTTRQDGLRSLMIGVGINIEPQVRSMAPLGPHAMPASSLQESENDSIDRTKLAASLLEAIVGAVDQFHDRGFSSFYDQWQQRDYLAHQRVQIIEGDHIRHGIAQGVDQNGALIVDIEGKMETLFSGEVSVRKS